MAKFTIEEAIESLNGRFMGKGGNTSLQLSDRTVKDTLSQFMSMAGEDEEVEGFISKVYPIMDSMNRNFKNDKSQFIKDYKPVETKPTTAPEPKEDEASRKRFETLEQQVAELIKREAEKDAALKSAEMRKAVNDELEKQGCTYGVYRRNAMYEVGIDAGKSIDDNVKAIKESYDKSVSEDVKEGIINPARTEAYRAPMSPEEMRAQAQKDAEFLKNSRH